MTIVKGTTFAVSADSRGAAVNLIEGILDVSTPAGGVVTQILGGQIASATKAAKGAISVIKTNGTGHKVIRSQRALEPKVKGGKVYSPKTGVRGLAFNNRGRGAKKPCFPDWLHTVSPTYLFLKASPNRIAAGIPSRRPR